MNKKDSAATQLAKWRRRALTLHQKAVDLALDMKMSDVGTEDVLGLAENVHIAVSELLSGIDESV